MVTETIFENRFMHVPELNRMGARHQRARRLGDRARRAGAVGRAGHGHRPARLGLADPGRAGRRAARPSSTASITSTAATRRSSGSLPRAARRSNGWSADRSSNSYGLAPRQAPYVPLCWIIAPPAPEIHVTTLLPSPLACCRWELENRRMVPPSNDALRRIIEADSDLVEDLNRYYGDATPDGGLDKLERELLLDLLSRHFTRQLWPRYRRDGGDAHVHGEPAACHGRRRLEDGRVRRRWLSPAICSGPAKWPRLVARARRPSGGRTWTFTTGLSSSLAAPAR